MRAACSSVNESPPRLSLGEEVKELLRVLVL